MTFTDDNNRPNDKLGRLLTRMDLVKDNNPTSTIYDLDLTEKDNPSQNSIRRRFYKEVRDTSSGQMEGEGVKPKEKTKVECNKDPTDQHVINPLWSLSTQMY